jgi:hypothetical protein
MLTGVLKGAATGAAVMAQRFPLLFTGRKPMLIRRNV